MSEWKEYKLDEICEITSSKRIFRKDYVLCGVPFFRSKEIIEKAKGANISTELFITKEKFDEIKKRHGIPKEWDILLSSVGTLGIPYQVKKDELFYFKDGNLTWFRNYNDLIEPSFLIQWLNSSIAKRKFSEITIGSTQPALTIRELKKLKIQLPDLSTQKAIAEILSSLDDKIELNNKINQNLEQLAQTIFDNLLFINRKMESTTVECFVLFNPRISVKKGTMTTFVEMKFLPTKGMNVTEVSAKPFTAGSKFEAEDTLLARITPCLENGKTAFVNFLDKDEKGFGSTEFITMRANEHSCPEFVYCLSRNADFRKHAIGSMVGSSGRQRIQLDMLKAFEIANIQNEEVLRFKEIVEPFFQQISHNRKETESLIQLRDTLLPKLITGKLEVSQTE